MGRFKDLLNGKTPAPAPKVEAAPAPEPVVEEVVEAPAPVLEVEETEEEVKVALEELTKDELEVYGRELGVELDKRHSKKALIKELEELGEE
jgi:hypothetical protein